MQTAKGKITHTSRRYLPFIVMAVAASFLFAGDVMAQDMADGAKFTGLLELIQSNAANWSARLEGYALNVFVILALIQLVWTFYPLVFKQADLGEIVGELIRFIVVTGFFYALLTNCTTWAGNVVDSFRQAGSSAAGLGSTGLKPGDMFDVAVQLADTVNNVDTWNPAVTFAVNLAACLVLLCFAFVAAFMGLTIIESYIVINASVLFMGFGGSSWTRDYAIAMLRYAVAVGAKLFVLTLLVGLIITSAKDWQAAYNAETAVNDSSMWTMVGLALTCAYFAKTLPELVAGLITGVSPGGGHTVGMMAGAAAAGAAAAAGVAATAATGGAAAPLAAGGAAAASGGAAAGGGAAAAGSGLAGSISASMAGGAGASTGAAGLGATGAGAGTMGGPGLGTAATTAARVGGNGLGAATGGGDRAGSSLGKLAAKKAQGANDGQASPASTESAAQQTGQPGTDNANDGKGLHTALNAATRATGIMAAISVPGMEGSAGLSLDSPPPSSGGNEEPAEKGGDFASDEGNSIRPADPVTESTATTASPASPPANNDNAVPSLASLHVPGMDKPPTGGDA